MAGNNINMSVIKEIIRQYFEDETSKKCIAKNLAISKNTVKKYLALAQADPLDYKSLLKIDDPILQYRFSSGNPAYSSDKYDDFKNLIKYYASELSEKHVTKKLLWEEYNQQNADGYKYTQFCHHLNQSIKKKPSVVTILSDTYVPGEKLFVDYAGDLLEYTDQFTSKVVKCQFFIACLPYSDYTFALAVHSQCQEDFMHALIQCFHVIGGVPKILVTDNLKAAVIKPSYKHSPTLNNLLVQVATHYRTTVIPTKLYSPTHKAKVESQVRIMYQRVYAKLRKRRFFSLHELNRAIAEAVKQHNQTRMTDRTYSREEHFLSNEKNYLKELPESDFEIRYIAELKVRDDCCIKLTRDKHYYSVPYQYIGQYAIVEYTRTMVKIFLKGKGLLIATHSREMGMGERTINKEHLASNSFAFLNKTKENYIERGFKRTPLLGEIINHMLNLPDTPPEFFYRRCDELLHMEASNKYLGSALGYQACYQGYKVTYYNIAKLLEAVKLARLEGSAKSFLMKLAKIDLLIIDDFGLQMLKGAQQTDLMEIIEDRHSLKSTIIIGQLPVSGWHEVLGGNIVSDAIMDRIVHTAHRFELKGESLRKK